MQIYYTLAKNNILSMVSPKHEPTSTHSTIILLFYFGASSSDTVLYATNSTQQSNHSIQINHALPDDVIRNFASYLGAKELAKFGLTCRALGWTVDIVAQQIILTSQTDRDRRALPRYGTEAWVKYYREYEKIQSPLTFDQIIGIDIHHEGDTRNCVVLEEGDTHNWSTAISNQIMRGQGKHYATFNKSGQGEIRVGIIRPINGLGWRGMTEFSPFLAHTTSEDQRLREMEALQGERTDNWGNSNIHCCMIEAKIRICASCDWESDVTWDDLEGVEALRDDCTFGMLLDLDEGTLTVYQDGQPLCQLKEGLSGEYCWATTMWKRDEGSSRVRIDKGQSPMH